MGLLYAQDMDTVVVLLFFLVATVVLVRWFLSLMDQNLDRLASIVMLGAIITGGSVVVLLIDLIR
jgi:hypothetical protein